MTFKGKPVTVMVIGEAKEELKELNKVVGEEKSKNILSSNNQTLLKSIDQKIELLKDNPEYGVHIPKDRIPKEYIIKYDVNNLWKVNLSGAWRMIYTIKGTEVEILALILDILDHKDYEKKFGYRN